MAHWHEVPELRVTHASVGIGIDVHGAETGGGVAKDRDRQLEVRVRRGVIAKVSVARALHREYNVARVFDGGGEGAILIGVRRRVIEADVERDDARLHRLERAQEVGIRLSGQRIAAVLRDRGVVDRHDRDLVADLGRRDGYRTVVDHRLQRRIEHLAGEERRADQDRDRGQERDHGELARVPLGEQLRASFGAGRRQIMRSVARRSTPCSTEIART